LYHSLFRFGASLFGEQPPYRSSTSEGYGNEEKLIGAGIGGMHTETNPVVADILWHPLVPSGTGNRQRILKLSEYAQGIALHHLGPCPAPESLPFLSYHEIRSHRPPLPALGFNRDILGYLLPQASGRVARAAVRLHPNVIHAEGLWATPAARRAARLSRVPLVVTINNLEHRVLRQRRRPLASSIVALLERRWYAAADHLIVVSTLDRDRVERFLKRHCPPLTVIPNGIDPPPSLPPPADLPHPNVLFLGKTDYPPNRDAIQTLIREWIPAARERGMTLQPVIVGGPDPARTEHGALFTGYVEDVWPYLAAADICVAPLRAGGGTRIKVLHYFAADKPIIASGIAVEGLNLENGVHYLEADRGADFSSALRRLTTSDTLRQTLIAHGREAMQRYHWRAIADRWAHTIQMIAL
jgi:glycosyltransferase involved in cell wall biosynthesis